MLKQTKMNHLKQKVQRRLSQGVGVLIMNQAKKITVKYAHGFIS